jgi:HK97 gp10 family phage protein
VPKRGITAGDRAALDERDLRKLRNLEKGTTRILRVGMRKATKIVMQSMKREVPQGTGLLRHSIGRKSKSFRKNLVVVGIVGARTQNGTVYNGRYHDPVNYSHIVDRGRGEVRVKKARFLTDGITVFGTRVGPAAAQPFIEPAFDDNVAEVISVFRDAVKAELAKV